MSPELQAAEVSFSCASCGRSIRVTVRDVREGRSTRCLAGHRVELETGEGIRRLPGRS